MPSYNLSRARGKARPKLVIKTVTGPSSYSTGGFTATIDELERVEDAIVIASGGYMAEVASISGNTVTIKVYDFNYPATAAGPAEEVAANTDLSSVSFKIIAIGM